MAMAKVRYVTHIPEPIPNPTTLRRVTSCGDVGSDIAGLRAAKEFGFRTGGHMPKGFMTVVGPKPGYQWMYQLRDDCSDFKESTWRNVEEADATIRLGTHFGDKDEYCTLKAIRHYCKPHLDINMEEVWYSGNGVWQEQIPPHEVAFWVVSNGIQVLNITGNVSNLLETPVYNYLQQVFNAMIWE